MARIILALLLFGMSLGGMAAVAYADQYANGGVAWGDSFPPVSNEVANPLGVNVFLEKEVDPQKIERTLAMTRDGGFRWVRQVFAWNDIEISGKGDFTDNRGPQPVDAWAKYDRIVSGCQRYGLEIIARLDSPPVWARIPGDDVAAYPKGPPRDYNDFGDFVYRVVSRYRGKVRYFQMWNEPNLIGEWGGHAVSPKEYTDLLKVAHDAAKRANPDAVVITAALAPTAEQSLRNLNDVLFLEGMYREGAAAYFDILSTMLYGLGQPPDERRTDLARLNFSRPILLHNVMERNGDAKKPIWISEYGWVSIPPDFEGDLSKNIWGKSVDEDTQARWLVEGYRRIRREWPWMGAVCVWHLRVPDPVPGEPANYFSILRDDFSPRPAYNAIKEYSKRFPMADTGTYHTDSAAIIVTREEGNGSVEISSNPSTEVHTDTLRFTGTRLDVTVCGDCEISLLGVDGSHRAENIEDTAIRRGLAEPPGNERTITLAHGLRYDAHMASVLVSIGPKAGSESPITFTVSREKPPLDAVGFPLLYGILALFGVASAGYAAAAVGRGAEAAINKPKGRYSEAVQEKARNGAAVLGMLGLVLLYMKTENPALILACLAGLGVVAFLKPSVAIAGVVVAIPFFWYPKQIHQQHFPIAETLLMITFGALMARRIVAYLLPGPAKRIDIKEVTPSVTGLRMAAIPHRSPNGKQSYIWPAREGRHPVISRERNEELLPARWPTRPVTGPLGTTKVQVAQVPPPNRSESVRDTAPLPVLREAEQTEQVEEREAGNSPRTTTHLRPRSQMRDYLEAVRWRFAEWSGEDAFAAPAVAMLIAGTLALFTLADPAFGRDSARAYRWTIVEPVLFYFLITDTVRSKRALWRVLDFLLATAVCISFLGIWQYIGSTDTLAVEGVSRVLGVYEHPNNLALYLGRILPFSAVAGIFLPWGWRKSLYLAATVPLGITTFLTFSRGAYVAVTVAIIVAIAVGLRTRAGTGLPPDVRRKRRVLYGSLASIVLGLALLLAPVLLPKVPARILAVGSSVLRIRLWESAAHMIADHPIFGVGPDQFLNQFQSRYITPEQQNESFTAHPHNLILDYWLSLGIIGLPILLYLLWRYFREAAGNAVRMALERFGLPLRAMSLGLMASMIDFVVHGMVDNSYFLMDLALIFWLLCGLLQVLRLLPAEALKEAHITDNR